jgi:peptide/nickel transport system permease protein
MLRTIATRLSGSALSLLMLVSATFALAHLTPGGPAYSILGLRAAPDAVGSVNMQLGLDVPLWRQYGLWLWHVLHLRLGYSYLVNRPVSELLARYAANTAILYSLALLISTAASIGLGLIQGVYAQRWPARLIGLLELTLYAVPSFVLATALVLTFAVTLHWLPASGLVDLHAATPTLPDYAAHLVLPVLTIALATTAALARYFAQSVQQELGQDYARTAAAKGLTFPRILFGHVTRNAMRPLVTLLGLSLPTLISGGVIVETVFSYPGLGWLLWRSALSQDYPVLVAIVLLIGVLTVLGNLAADLLNMLLDPRARYG